MKKVLNFMLALCFVFSCLLTLSACGGDNSATGTNYAKNVAGKYTYTEYNTSGNYVYELTNVFEVKNDGSFEYITEKLTGSRKLVSGFKGTLVVDANNKITSVTFENIAENLMESTYQFGQEVENATNIELDSEEQMYLTYTQSLYEALFKNFMFVDNSLITISNYGEYSLLVKEGTQKPSEDTILKVLTKKDVYDMAKEIRKTNNCPNYETDFYFVKDSYDLSNESKKDSFIYDLGLRFKSFVIKDGKVETTSILDISEIEGFDLSSTGTKTGTIKYKNLNETVSKQVTYTVVEKENNLPENKIVSIELNDHSEIIKDVVYIKQGKELYEINLELSCETCGGAELTEKISEENCTSENKVITISDYDKEKVGYQLVKIEYRGATTYQPVFVYNEEVNPMKWFIVDTECSVTIETSEEDSTKKEIKLTNNKLYLDRFISTGTSESKTIELSWAKDLKDASEYNKNEKIIFEYKETIDGYEWSYFFMLTVKAIS